MKGKRIWVTTVALMLAVGLAACNDNDDDHDDHDDHDSGIFDSNDDEDD